MKRCVDHSVIKQGFWSHQLFFDTFNPFFTLKFMLFQFPNAFEVFEMKGLTYLVVVTSSSGFDCWRSHNL